MLKSLGSEVYPENNCAMFYLHQPPNKSLWTVPYEFNTVIQCYHQNAITQCFLVSDEN